MPGLGQSSACVGWDGLKYTQRWFAARTAQGRRDGALGSAVGSGAARYHGVHIRMPYQQAEEPDSTDSLEFLLVCCAFPAPCRDGEGPRGKKKIHVHMCVCAEHLLPFMMWVFSGALSAICGARDSDSTWREGKAVQRIF